MPVAPGMSFAQPAPVQNEPASWNESGWAVSRSAGPDPAADEAGKLARFGVGVAKLGLERLGLEYGQTLVKDCSTWDKDGGYKISGRWGNVDGRG